MGLFKSVPKASFSQEHQWWIGKTMVAAVTTKISYGQEPGMVQFSRYVMASETIYGKVAAVTERCVQVDDKWYEINSCEVGGIRVIEVF